MKSLTSKSLTYFLLVVFAFIFAFPFYYMLVLSTVPGTQIYQYPPHIFFKTSLFTNIKALFEDLPFLVNFFNSVGIAVLSTASVIFFCTMGGFALSKYEFKGKKLVFLFILSTMAIPPFLNIIPFFKMMVTFHMYGTWLPLIVPNMANAFGIILMTQFMKDSIPNELMDAARIDGLSELKILTHIGFPLSKSGIAVLGIVTFINSWNNFMGALVMLPNTESTTLPVALSKLFLQMDGDRGGLMAGTVLAVLPLMVVFIIFNKQIIAGLTAGSVKG
ncbi:carbohydrate ABC transporter permease [Spirochaeta cellobiosiphila]|uniref:carbohydrate ABC transporter permease n=1 Tax=Spirochaeta cellobiosiphila TaxID=504483 RepID=UPI000422FCEC|nr:carbohydrate ABC transporter permease [Spirochaeta cellobiosiphila]